MALVRRDDGDGGAWVDVGGNDRHGGRGSLWRAGGGGSIGGGASGLAVCGLVSKFWVLCDVLADRACCVVRGRSGVSPVQSASPRGTVEKRRRLYKNLSTEVSRWVTIRVYKKLPAPRSEAVKGAQEKVLAT